MKKNLLASGIVNPFSPTLCREKMREEMKKIIMALIAVVLFFFLLPPVSASAAGTLAVDDGADLLSDTEEAELIRRYSPITEYMDAAFVSTDHSEGSTSSYTEKYAIQHYGNDPAVIFMIDMDDREIYIYSNGSALKTISKADARAITDNIYQYASRGEYFECADAAFSQIYTKCQAAIWAVGSSPCR